MSDPHPAVSPDVAATAAKARRQLHWMVFGVFLLNLVLFLLASRLQRKEPAANPAPPTATSEAR